MELITTIAMPGLSVAQFRIYYFLYHSATASRTMKAQQGQCKVQEFVLAIINLNLIANTCIKMSCSLLLQLICVIRNVSLKIMYFAFIYVIIDQFIYFFIGPIFQPVWDIIVICRYGICSRLHLKVILDKFVKW